MIGWWQALRLAVVGRRTAVTLLLAALRRARDAEARHSAALLAHQRQQELTAVAREVERRDLAQQITALRQENKNWAGICEDLNMKLAAERAIGNRQANLLGQLPALAYHSDMPPHLATTLRRLAAQIPTLAAPVQTEQPTP